MIHVWIIRVVEGRIASKCEGKLKKQRRKNGF
jgi:hypothetical protein